MSSLETVLPEVVPGVLRALNLGTDEEITYRRLQTAHQAITSYNGELDVHVSASVIQPTSADHRYISDVALYTQSAEHTLRGLFQNVRATAYRTPYSMEGVVRLDVEAISSTQAINNASRKLGRIPGENAFELVSKPGMREYTASEWITGACSVSSACRRPTRRMGNREARPGFF